MARSTLPEKERALARVAEKRLSPCSFSVLIGGGPRLRLFCEGAEAFFFIFPEGLFAEAFFEGFFGCFFGAFFGEEAPLLGGGFAIKF